MPLIRENDPLINFRADAAILLDPVIPLEESKTAQYIFKRQQSLFNCISLQTFWGIPISLRNQDNMTTLGSMAKDLKEYSKVKPSEKLTQVIAEVEQASEFALYEYAINNSEPKEAKSLTKEFKKDLKTSIESLEPGKSILIPVGTSAHAMEMELICREMDGRKIFDAKIFNSGLGTHFHDSPDPLSFMNPWAKIETMSIQGIHAELLMNQLSEFINALTDVQFHSQDVSQVYRVIQKYLITIGKGVPVRNLNQVHHLQSPFWGSCSTKSANFWLQEKMGRTAYREFKVMKTERMIAHMTHLSTNKNFPYGKKWNIGSSLFARAFYYLFNFIPIDVQITLAKGILAKRKFKARLSVSDV